MTGLRARQKADRNRRILDAAAVLFREVGYDSARIEDIAERAEISVGTFYNYYENKGDILLATVSMEVEEVLAGGGSIVDNPPASVMGALDALIGEYYDHSLYYLSKEMWRTAMAIAIQQPESPFSKRYTELDRRLCEQVSTLIRKLQAKGVVALDVDAEAVGEMFFNNLNMMFTEFAKRETMSLDDLKARVSRQNRPLATLIAVR
ncbi:TetR/AcrR family transcriptional regulator [Ensifer sp. ENS07]|jgi:AcrR family transcriptional regulator|uniref:TetR/AcrR family transcriptional regulator n=1 Tax=Ensifer adhaerens TaxID=106592 RepID=A0A9Q9D887_ENSAD|nr:MULTISPECIES: TetR/AcrR family transcriptional regulator [Ensifer]OWZ89847.1 TetR family transcriptional regulator [Sinorhizobium sp. LM21]MBD9495809.1 TetR/AcrR family transcriptional regulator [Ensifer sp. ENS01]MBD9523420.1 TetR/AcrR family transcriptional regulator [Ensifer sp. ENS02]MBD9593596.1 TetR/AcrR family transcriptional regulator [Ensifer sp. ENS05]MBD9641182.1 TetR/AcrR family transcriptional regulator [Ensifer sp. ENS07]